MTNPEKPRILCLDDEKNVLEGLARTLRVLYHVETSTEGAAALDLLRTQGPFAVVVSDLRMPKMSGIDFLAAARTIVPDTSRILLTGYGDMEAAIAAVNDGNIFRFLTKPCPTGVLVKALAAGVEANRLVTSEKVLLEQTLQGSVKVLSEILALANPTAFGRATRVQRTLAQLQDHCQVKDRWAAQVAAVFSQIGAVTLPSRTQERVYHNDALTKQEEEMVERLPHVTESLLAHIPRLEGVRDILRLQARRYDGKGAPADNISGERIPWGARALKLALDLDLLESDRESSISPVEVLRSRVGWYDPPLLEAIAALRGENSRDTKLLELRFAQMRPGMVFAEDVRSSKGLLLIARGQEVTASLLERIQNSMADHAIREPVQMILNKDEAAAHALKPALK
ncbi:MAG TPA: HD domain-containing phosphohydrolase [Verrucomicrobiae bacterium]|nr:HD domain-containing phosphohydrolase [Verrucomicrobiae bacterium]